MKIKKALSLGLSMAMCVSALTACGSKPADANSAQNSDASGAANEETTNIIWMVRNSEPKNYDSVMAAVNEKMKKDINMTLDLRFIDPGDYNTKMQMAMAGGDEWDLCFTSHWANNYVNAAGKGALLELSEDMLKKNAPHVMETIPERLWDGIRVNNGIYALMNYQVMYNQGGYMLLKEAVDKCGIDINAIKTAEDLDAVLEKFKAEYPDRYAARGSRVDFDFENEAPCQIMGLPFLAVDPETKKIDKDIWFNYGSKGYEQQMRWKQNGWVPADAATMKDEQQLLQSGQMLSRHQSMKPGLDSALKLLYGNDWVSFPTSEKLIKTASAQSTLTGVNINSKNPEKAIQMFDYVFSNKEVANMLFFGLEGQDYELVDGRVKPLENCWTAPAWMLGNQFNAMLTETAVEGVWEETMKGNEEAEYELIFGFVPDRTPIETELATCEAIWGEYKDILDYGLQDYHDVLPEMFDKLQKAGLDKVTAELQTQLDAFFASQAA